jgi:PilZ domain
MSSTFLPNEPNLGSGSQLGERRKNARFAMHFPVFVRALGEPWTRTETADISAAGAFFICDRQFLINATIEYVMIFPQELTKAARPLLVRFFGAVIRAEQVAKSGGLCGVAVRNTGHRYLTHEESVSFTAMQPALSSAASSKVF